MIRVTFPAEFLGITAYLVVVLSQPKIAFGRFQHLGRTIVNSPSCASAADDTGRDEYRRETLEEWPKKEISMTRKLFRSISAYVFWALLILTASPVEAQTPGQIPMFDQPGTGVCNNAGRNDCIDSVMTQSGGNIGIGTTAPAAKLDVAGGNVHLENSSLSSGNILKGINLFLHNFGYSNTFLGENAGNLTMTGAHNTGIGLQGLLSNTTGDRNTAVGRSTLQLNTAGADNTANGAAALASNTSGSYNTAVGSQALFNNSTVVDFSGVTHIGQNNTAVGGRALFSNTSGSNNTALGYNALYSNAVGGGEFYVEGINNTATGVNALVFNLNGTNNTASGYNALRTNTWGSNDTAIGASADVSSDGIFNATAIGAGAVVNASNKIRLGNTAVTVVEGPPYSTVSDKNAKENFKSVDAEEVLEKIRAMNVTSWNYIGQDPKQFRHYGPVAQDFFAAFGDDGLGIIGSPRTIASTDMNGVLMLAVQALGRENEAFEAENADLKARIEALERLVKGLQK
jgi:hypothetical protein